MSLFSVLSVPQPMPPLDKFPVPSPHARRPRAPFGDASSRSNSARSAFTSPKAPASLKGKGAVLRKEAVSPSPAKRRSGPPPALSRPVASRPSDRMMIEAVSPGNEAEDVVVLPPGSEDEARDDDREAWRAFESLMAASMSPVSSVSDVISASPLLSSLPTPLQLALYLSSLSATDRHRMLAGQDLVALSRLSGAAPPTVADLASQLDALHPASFVTASFFTPAPYYAVRTSFPFPTAAAAVPVADVSLLGPVSIPSPPFRFRSSTATFDAPIGLGLKTGPRTPRDSSPSSSPLHHSTRDSSFASSSWSDEDDDSLVQPSHDLSLDLSPLPIDARPPGKPKMQYARLFWESMRGADSSEGRFASSEVGTPCGGAFDGGQGDEEDLFFGGSHGEVRGIGLLGLQF